VLGVVGVAHHGVGGPGPVAIAASVLSWGSPNKERSLGGRARQRAIGEGRLAGGGESAPPPPMGVRAAGR